MKQLALVFTLFIGLGISDMQAQESPACCSPEWCKIFCGGEKNCDIKKCDLKASTVANVSPKSCQPKSCEKIAKSCSPTNQTAKAVAQTVSNKSTKESKCCEWIPGCCTAKNVSLKASCGSAKTVESKKVAMVSNE